VWTGLNAVSNALFGALLWPAQLAPAWLAGALLGALSALLALLVFRAVSRRTRAYLARAALPALVLAGPLALAAIQLEARFVVRPLEAGEHATLRVELDAGARASELPAEIRVPRGLTLETPALRKDRTREIAWRVRADLPGRYLVKIQVGEQEYERRILVGAQRFALARRVCASGDAATLLAPSERALASAGPVRCIEVDYPTRAVALGLSGAAWSFFAAALAFTFTLRRLFGTRP
jgi:hypothetical protein